MGEGGAVACGADATKNVEGVPGSRKAVPDPRRRRRLAASRRRAGEVAPGLRRRVVAVQVVEHLACVCVQRAGRGGAGGGV